MSSNQLELIRRFGNPPRNILSRFGGDFVNGLAGWQFSESEVRDANCSGRLLTMDLDFPGSRCKLNCKYCFAKAGEKTGTYYRQDRGDKPLTIQEIKTRLLEAKELGLRSVKIIGYREPFDNPGIHDFLDFLAANEIIPVVFTAAYTLGEARFGHNIQRAINFLADRNVSLMVKFHTLDEKKEDKIVQCKGYSALRDIYLTRLLDDGRFTSQTPTRLGIENVLSSQNIPELLDVYEYFKMLRNVFVDIDPPIPVGRTGTLEEAERAGLMSQAKLRGLCVGIYTINQRYRIPFFGVSPYFGAAPCTQLPNGLYLTLSGKVVTCCGGDEVIGDARTQTIKEIFERNPYRNREGVYHDCPYRQKRGIMTRRFIEAIERQLR